MLDKNKVYIIDNFFNKEDQIQILEKFHNKPITLNFKNIYYNDCNLNIDSSIYTKMLSEKQFIIDLGQEKTPFLEKLESKLNIKINTIIRSKINWIFRESIEDKNGYYPPHTDNIEDHWVLLYYVCNSDGDTLIFEETHEDIPFLEVSNQTLHIMDNVEHKMGRGVLFHGSRYHCGLPPLKSDYRITFNHNFTIKE